MPPFPRGRFVDPAFEAQLHAEERGLRDLLQDTARERRRSERDTRLAIRGVRRQRRRSISDILRDSRRSEHDIRLGAERGMEDFGMQLQGLLRSYAQLGSEQGQRIGAAGLGGPASGAARLAAQRRAENLAFERQPIDIGMQRLQEDTTEQLRRLGVDTRTALRRTRQDSRLEIRGLRRDQLRRRQDLRTERQRGRRELRFSRPSLAAQARFQAQYLRQTLNPFRQQP